MSAVNSFDALDTLDVAGTEYQVFRIDKVPGYEKLPFSLKVLLENLLRTEDGKNVTDQQIRALGAWQPTAEPDTAHAHIHAARRRTVHATNPAHSTDIIRHNAAAAA